MLPFARYEYRDCSSSPSDFDFPQAETLRVKIGYPTTPNVTDAVSLQRYFSRLEITDDLFANELNVRWAQ